MTYGGLMKSVLASALALLQISCSWLPRKTETPVRTLIDEAPGGSKELVVLLPGRLTTPEEFERVGFLDLVREAYPDARIARPDLHLGYYKKRSAIDRLHEDIVEPAKADGLDKVTLVGISMGGLGAMLYDLQHPGLADELILLSPFLGEAEVIAEIDAAGRLPAWQVPPQDERDFSRTLWQGIKKREGRGAPILLGCGNDDRLAPTSRLAARELPMADDPVWQSGGHDWPTWRRLFREIRGLP